MKDLIEALTGNTFLRVFIAFLFSTFIEISPIKLNPITALKKLLGVGNSKRILEELSVIKSSQEGLTKEIGCIKAEITSVKNDQIQIKNDQASLKTEIQNLSSEMDQMKADDAETKAEDARFRILRFNDEILHGMNHSKEHFEQTIMDIENYDAYCKDHPDFKNHITKISSKRILSEYEKNLENHSFLDN